MSWSDLPVKVKIYISSLSVLSIFVSSWAALELVNNFSVYDKGWLVLTALALITIPAYCFSPSVSTLIGIGDAYIMAIGMIYGVAPCIVATFLQSLIISVVAQKPKVHCYKIVFNTASTVCGAWIYSTVYHYVNGGSQDLLDIIVAATALVITFFLVNSILTSIAIAWSREESIIQFWVKACVPLALDYSISTVFATFIVGLSSIKWYIPFLVAPFLTIVWGWNKLLQSRHQQTQKHLEEQEQLYLQTVESLALAVDAKDQTTYGHIRRVRVYAMGLAKLCGVRDKNELNAIMTGALLHDIGKIAIADYILNKPGRLSKKEYEKVKQHAAAGDEILQQVRFPYPVAKYVRHHHERWDGQGYPDGLKGEEIPLGARILSIADAFDAIRFSRPYKPSIQTDEAKDLLRQQAGTAYDPILVHLFIDHIDELEQQAIKESENATQLSFRKYSETAEDPHSVASATAAIVRDIPGELVRLAELCSSTSDFLQLEDILAIIAQRLKIIVPFTTLVFYRRDGDDRMRTEFAYGKFSDLLKDRTIEMGQGISGWAAAYKQPMINTSPALDFQDVKGDFEIFGDALVAPIVYGDESLGTISLYAEAPISYSQKDLNILQTLAGLLAPLAADANQESSEAQGIIDPVTCLNRVSFLTALGPQLISLAAESQTPVSLIYVEIANLPQIVRSLGQNLGNSILRRVADCIRPELRDTDILVRYGYQGFAALLPGVREDQALRCAQRLNRQIRQVSVAPGQGFTIDCRTGVSLYPVNGSTVIALLQAAQENLRKGSGEKSSGDNKVVDFHRA